MYTDFGRLLVIDRGRSEAEKPKSNTGKAVQLHPHPLWQGHLETKLRNGKFKFLLEMFQTISSNLKISRW